MTTKSIEVLTWSAWQCLEAAVAQLNQSCDRDGLLSPPKNTAKGHPAGRRLWLCQSTRGGFWVGCLACLEVVCRADNPTLDATSYPYVGVTLSHYSASSPKQNINVVDIDLAAPGIQFRVTPEVEGLPNNSSGTPYTVMRQFTLDFLNSQGAQIAIDASRYWPTTDGPGTLDGSGTPVNLEGVVASAGSVYESFFNAWRAPPPPGISWPALNIGFSNQVAILYGDPADPLGHTPLPEVDDNFGHQSMEPPMALWNTVSGNYQVVSNGIPITPDRLFLANDLDPNPRTGIGFTTNNHLILVAVDGGGSPWLWDAGDRTGLVHGDECGRV